MLEPLYPLLRHHDPNIQTAALSLLHNLSILEENEAKVINMGYVPEVRRGNEGLGGLRRGKEG